MKIGIKLEHLDLEEEGIARDQMGKDSFLMFLSNVDHPAFGLLICFLCIFIFMGHPFWVKSL